MQRSLKLPGAPSLRSSVEIPTILFVDDDPNIVAAMQRNFRPFRINLITASDGLNGISEAIDLAPDLVVTDLGLPTASGEELIQCISMYAKLRHTPIVVVTGNPVAQLTNEMRMAGVKQLLKKPISFDALFLIISEFVDLKRKDS